MQKETTSKDAHPTWKGKSIFHFLKRFSPKNGMDIIKRELKSGITPEKISLSIVVGAGMGVFPLIGTTMTLCGILGILFRLNPVAIQLANYLVYPLQILLIFPFLQTGSMITSTPLDLDWAENISAENVSAIAKGIFDVAGFAVLGWLVWVPGISIVLYFLLLPFMKKASSLFHSKRIR
ncbi:PF09835 family protein [Leptospira alstonii serovar Pingchang str. 80-412]|uniref:PF09835 family protein n=3 Tax=Leptospira alstonii TaxID=28452 RepID=M6D1Q8_9LEPT|nr:PF09835 family protein [Leptospira alstonii serovar Sichuan str. 79601]EQA78802.1 PF09835 family protein [Leptospira alstonii serovar Pingchang str. 80-412]